MAKEKFFLCFVPALTKQNKSCDADKATLLLILSNGVVITETSSIADLFAATNWAVGRGGGVDDQTKLLAVYKALNTCHKD